MNFKYKPIQRNILLGCDLGSVSIAQRMAWASRRVTTRVEDTAYSLMGIFDVNMPMLYGEGERAFIRLQEEIMKVSDDQTIFAWKSNRMSDNSVGLLASSPAAFVDSGTIIQWAAKAAPSSGNLSFAITNRGIRLELPLLAIDGRTITEKLGILDCKDLNNPNQLLGVWLRKISGTKNVFERYASHTFGMTDNRVLQSSEIQSIHVRQGRLWLRTSTPYEQYHINLDGFRRLGFEVKETFPTNLMKSDGRILPATFPTGLMKSNARSLYHGNIFGAIKFEDDFGFQFILILRNTVKLLFISALMDFGSETLEEVILSFGNHTTTTNDGTGTRRRIWVYESDRIFRPHPSKGTLCLAVKRQMDCGHKQFVVDISCIN